MAAARSEPADRQGLGAVAAAPVGAVRVVAAAAALDGDLSGLLFLPLACGSVRMVAWWLLICTPILAAQLTDLWPRLTTTRRCGRSSLVRQRLRMWDPRPGDGPQSAVAGSVQSGPVRPGRAHRTETDLQAIADRLGADGDGGRIFTRFAWGEYLGWSLAPRYTVFMDGRIEIIPDEVWRQYGAVNCAAEAIGRTSSLITCRLPAAGHERLSSRTVAVGGTLARWQQVCRQGK